MESQHTRRNQKIQLFGNSEQLKLLQDKALGIVGATAKGGRSEGMERIAEPRKARPRASGGTPIHPF